MKAELSVVRVTVNFNIFLTYQYVNRTTLCHLDTSCIVLTSPVFGRLLDGLIRSMAESQLARSLVVENPEHVHLESQIDAPKLSSAKIVSALQLRQAHPELHRSSVLE